jgi:hypothetical protein
MASTFIAGYMTDDNLLETVRSRRFGFPSWHARTPPTNSPSILRAVDAIMVLRSGTLHAPVVAYALVDSAVLTGPVFMAFTVAVLESRVMSAFNTVTVGRSCTSFCTTMMTCTGI